MLKRAPKRGFSLSGHLPVIAALRSPRRFASGKPDLSKETQPSKDASKSEDITSPQSPQVVQRKKTMAELDEEMKEKMSGLSGEGGDAGVEYEDGQPVSMKRSVKNNMFRYI
ncbi:uncharacterized protein BCR38DRAFT_408670 [Pseudomassariella vexata]|uniref:Uncharacterized protein n=1 Tax=Pseudomassariella vexata TaxID=1141098 RepID=A0A1Y2E043_9PEZI|nr:uncharacterized protein BCR38DRAFT_408670 [Pseudomassariella vexata]ORY64910.1 hypothetical protein BCR38DRAFT_408670 [Pseudomassariella vexata]